MYFQNAFTPKYYLAFLLHLFDLPCPVEVEVHLSWSMCRSGVAFAQLQFTEPITGFNVKRTFLV